MDLPAIGFENLGTSCFINAGIQVLLAIPGLADRLGAGFSPSERALTAVINTTTNRLGPVTPRPLTDLFYHGRQEDAAEFVLELLTGCSGLRELLEGVEHPRFRCRHCTYSRPAALEKFVSLQLPLMGTTRFVSVQEALNNYLNAEHVQEDLQDWVCCTDECLNAGRALDMPLYQTRITKWPDVLLIFLKRWDSAHGLLAHNVYCNNILMAEGNAYSLRSLITHIGHDPSSGHYVAYRHCQEGFRRLDDTRIAVASHVEGFFSRVPEEKVYVIVYHKQDLSNPSPAPVSRQPDDLSRRPAAKRLAIDLDSDSDAQKVSRNPDTDSDSDVVLARDDDPQSIGLPRDKDASVVPVTSADHIDIDADSGRTMTLAAWTCCMLEVAPLSGRPLARAPLAAWRVGPGPRSPWRRVLGPGGPWLKGGGPLARGPLARGALGGPGPWPGAPWFGGPLAREAGSGGPWTPLAQEPLAGQALGPGGP